MAMDAAGVLEIDDSDKFMSAVEVLLIAPFWRYAVGPASNHSPAIPYYTLAGATEFFEEARRELPWAGVVLYKRRWLRGIEAIMEYVPDPKKLLTETNL